ncbi:hypothetical protein IJE86_01390 [bacterium]|nr:hypothetical protein [bacterium]
MKIIKNVKGKEVLVELKKIKDYGRYGLYQVYKITGNVKEAIQLNKIIQSGYRVADEEEFE